MSITSDRIKENGFIHFLCDEAADDIEQLEKQLTAEQHKVKVLTDALECIRGSKMCGPYVAQIAEEAIATVKGE